MENDNSNIFEPQATNIFEEQHGTQEEFLRRHEMPIAPVSALEVLSAGVKKTTNDLPTYNYIYSLEDEDKKIESKELIAKAHPDVPSAIFNEDMSNFRATILAEKWRQEAEYEGLKKFRDPVFASLYDFASSSAIMSDPTIAVANLLTGWAVGAGMTALGISAEAMPVLTATGKFSTKLFAKRVAVGTALEFAQNLAGTFSAEYPLRKATEKFTNQKYSVKDVLFESAAGAVLLSPFHAIGHAYKGYVDDVKIKTIADYKQAKAFAQYADSLKNQIEELSIKGENADSYSNYIKNHAYNYYGDNQKTFTTKFPDNAPTGSVFGLKRGFYDGHFSPNPKLEGTVSMSSTGDVVRGTAKATGASGELFYIDTTDMRFLKEDQLVNFINSNPEIFEYLGLKEGQKIENLLDLDDAEMAMLAIDLSKRGYDGIVRKIEATVKQISRVDEPFTVEIFKDKFDKINKTDLDPINVVKQIGYDPVSTTAVNEFNPERALEYIQSGQNNSVYEALTGEGYLSNGKKITLDAEGYFKSDVMLGKEEALSYVEVFSQEMLDEIKLAQEQTGSIEGFDAKFEIITKDIQNFLEELKIYEELVDAATKYDEVFNRLMNPFEHRNFNASDWNDVKNIFNLSDKELQLFKADIESMASKLDAPTAKNNIDWNKYWENVAKTNEANKPENRVAKKILDMVKEVESLKPSKNSLERIMQLREETDNIIKEAKVNSSENVEKLIDAYSNCLKRF